MNFLDAIFEWIVDALAEVLGDRFTDRRRRRIPRRRFGAHWTTVPDLRDLPVSEARDALARAGLRMTVVRQTAGAEPATGTVIGQDPPAWQAARRRHRVTVRI